MNGRLGAFAAITALCWAGSPAQPDLDRARSLVQAGSFKAAATSYRTAISKDASLTPAWRELASCLSEIGEQKEASRILDNLLTLNPKDLASLNTAGEIRLTLGDHRGALAYFKRSLALDPGQRPTRLRMGEALELAGETRQAVAEYRHLVKLTPLGKSDPDTAVSTRVHLARGLAKLEQVQEATQILKDTERVYRKGGNSERIRKTLRMVHQASGDLQFSQEHFKEAAEAYREAAHLDPSNPSPLLALGWALRRAENDTSALEIWTKALALPGGETPQQLRAIADLHMDAGRLEQAQTLYEKAQQLAPSDPNPTFQLAEIAFTKKDQALRDASLARLQALPSLDSLWWQRVAESFAGHEEVEAGLAFFQKLPESPGQKLGLARLYIRKAALLSLADHAEEGISFYNKALAIDPNSQAALRDLGWTLAKLGRWKECQTTWQSYVARFPKEPEPYELLGEAQMHNGDNAGAIASEKKALELDPSGMMPRIKLLRGLAQDGYMEESLKLARSLAQEFPRNLNVLSRHAELETRFQHHPEALACWEKVLSLDPSDPRAKANWIRESYATGHYEAALNEARKATESRPAPLSALSLLAQDALAQKHLEDAAKWYRRMTQDYPHRIELWVQLGGIYHMMGQLTEAMEVAAEGLRQNPLNPDIEIFQAECLVESGRIREGLAQFNYLRDHPGNRLVFRGLYYSLVAAQKYPEAMQLLTGTIHESFLNQAETSYWKAEVLGGMGHFPEAKAQLADLLNQKAGVRHVPIILYHGILDQDRTVSISPSQFDLQMKSLAQAGYNTITLNEMADMIAGRNPWPAKPLLITFDDARTDTFVYADPILAKYGMKATMFVPTALPTKTGDCFQASWVSIKGYGTNGRWDMQAHGFHAHEPIRIDASGTEGRFLTAHQWLADEKRMETDEEFQKRLDVDYRDCAQMMRERIPGANPLGFAFPFNEAGQINVGNRNDATSVNENIWRKHFRFGMVQDSTGYNTVRPGEQGSRLLWRFEPEGSWSGEQLLSYLAGQDPKNYARLQMARLTLWEGNPRKARESIESIQGEVPALRKECQDSLSEVAWCVNRPREARDHLQEAQALDTKRSPFQERMSARLAWLNNPLVTTGADYLQDSDHRNYSSDYVNIRYPFHAPVDLEIQVGRVSFQERNRGSVFGGEAKAKLSWDCTQDFGTSVWARQRILRGAEDRLDGGAAATFSTAAQTFSIAAERSQVETNLALAAGISKRLATLNYGLKSGTVAFNLMHSRSLISDGNRVDNTRANLMLQPGDSVDWHIGLEAGRDASTFTSSYYHAPTLFKSLRGRVQYRAQLADDSSLSMFSTFGGGEDQQKGRRWVGSMGLNWLQNLSAQWRLNLALQADSTQGYNAQQGSVSIQYHF